MRQALRTLEGQGLAARGGIPRISSVSVIDLSPWSFDASAARRSRRAIELIVLDSTASPWPLAATPRVSNPDL